MYANLGHETSVLLIWNNVCYLAVTTVAMYYFWVSTDCYMLFIVSPQKDSNFVNVAATETYLFS